MKTLTSAIYFTYAAFDFAAWAADAFCYDWYFDKKPGFSKVGPRVH